jgi:hypothetical protein
MTALDRKAIRVLDAGGLKRRVQTAAFRAPWTIGPQSSAVVLGVLWHSIFERA